MKNNGDIICADIVIINDNNLNFLGGERESQLIIINEASKKYKLAVIQPGEFEKNIENVSFYWKTKYTRMKYLIKNPIAFLNYIFKTAKLIREIKPKIVHSNSQVSFFMVSLMKRFYLINRKIKLVHTDRGLYTKYNCFFRWLFQYSFKFTDILITTTNFNKISWKNANEKKGIKLDYNVIGNTAGEIYETIDEKKIKNNPYITIGFAGRMCDWKDWPLAEKICEEVYKNIPEAHYKMYVSCFDEKAKAETNDLFKRMHNKFGKKFQGRINVPFIEMEKFYYDIDIYILTSWKRTESFGRTIVEAMSRKTAILTTDAGGAVEVVNNSKTVCNNVQEFVKKIKILNDDRKLLENIKILNLERVRKEYTLEKNVSKYMKVYEEMMKS